MARRIPITLPAALLALAGAAAAYAQPAPTPADVLGPFYPRDWRGDTDSDLTRVLPDQPPAEGTVLVVEGRVSDASGAPVADALVEIWQADARGHYRHPDDPGKRDPAFQGYGRARTDAQGAYRFRTIRPPGYGGRPPHIHFRVVGPGFAPLVTQMYFADDARADRLSSSDAAARRRLSVTPAPLADTPGAYRARFDIVLDAGAATPGRP